MKSIITVVFINNQFKTLGMSKSRIAIGLLGATSIGGVGWLGYSRFFSKCVTQTYRVNQFMFNDYYCNSCENRLDMEGYDECLGECSDCKREKHLSFIYEKQ